MFCVKRIAKKVQIVICWYFLYKIVNHKILVSFSTNICVRFLIKSEKRLKMF